MYNIHNHRYTIPVIMYNTPGIICVTSTVSEFIGCITSKIFPLGVSGNWDPWCFQTCSHHPALEAGEYQNLVGQYFCKLLGGFTEG